MATSFPGALDDYTNKTFGSTILSQHVNDLQDAMEAIQGKIGIGIVGGSVGETNSTDWLVRSPSSTDPGHLHTGAAITGGITESSITRPGNPILARVGQNEVVTGDWVYNSSAGVEHRAGYGSLPSAANALRIAAGGGSPNSTSFCWGDNTGWKLHFGTNVSSVFTPRLSVLDQGGVAINYPLATGETALLVHEEVPETAFIGTHKGALAITSVVTDTRFVSMTFITGPTGNADARIGLERDDNGDINNLYFGTASTGGSGIDNTMLLSGKGNFGVGEFREVLGGGPSRPKFQAHIYGPGYTSGGANTAEAFPQTGVEGGALYVQSSNRLPGDGGAVLFGARSNYTTDQLGMFAAIKGSISDGGENTAGSLTFSVRGIIGATTLTELMRLSHNGMIGMGTARPSCQLEIRGNNTWEGANLPCAGTVSDSGVEHVGGSLLLTDTGLNGIGNVDHGGSIYFGVVPLLIGNPAVSNSDQHTKVSFAIRSLNQTVNEQSQGSLAFASRIVHTDSALTEVIRFTAEGDLCVGCTGVTRTGYVDNKNAVLAVRGRGLSGSAVAGVIELSSNADDDVGNLLGSMSWSDKHVASGDKLVATFNVVSDGGSAGNRGGKLAYIHRDSLGSNALRQSLTIHPAGTLEIRNIDSAPADADAGSGYIYLKSGDLYFRGETGGEQLIKSG